MKPQTKKPKLKTTRMQYCVHYKRKPHMIICTLMRAAEREECLNCPKFNNPINPIEEHKKVLKKVKEQ